MAYDVTNFVSYMQRRGGKAPDFEARTLAMVTGALLLLPLYYFKLCSYQRGQLGYRLEAYAVRDGKYYSHFRTG
jgi:ubiquinol-cytochrome c reductase cytochrome c1 subunit